MQNVRSLFLLTILVGASSAKFVEHSKVFATSNEGSGETDAIPEASASVEVPSDEPEADERCVDIVNCEYQPVDCECGKFFQCRDGVYSEVQCPDGLQFNLDSKMCDLPSGPGCNLDVQRCCPCAYIGESCSADYIFQDPDRSVEFEGMDQCIEHPRSCANGLVWNPAANAADGACDFKDNIAGGCA